MAWQPLHVREFGIGDGPYEGIPGHLTAMLWEWASTKLGISESVVRTTALMARISLPAGAHGSVLYGALMDACIPDESSFLAVIDALLALFGENDPRWVEGLRSNLAIGNSVWTTAPDKKGLTSRVDPTAEAAVKDALAPHDAASQDLAEAWRNAYGREPNPSDAWDHSIKAVEHILRSLVCPANTKATLANVVGQLRGQPHIWRLLLPGKERDYGVDKLVAILDLIWPNPDRHGGVQNRAVTLDEARAVVHLAVTVVQWGRAGVLMRR